MTRIRQSETMTGALKVQADVFCRSRGDGRVRVARVYRVEKTRDGSGAEEYVLVRYENRLRAAMSSLLRVEGEGYALTFTEICRDARKKEGDMIIAWMDKEGAVRDGLK